MSQTEYEYQKGEQIQCAFLVRLLFEVSNQNTDPDIQDRLNTLLAAKIAAKRVLSYRS